jgi:hypothetical protein
MKTRILFLISVVLFPVLVASGGELPSIAVMDFSTANGLNNADLITGRLPQVISDLLVNTRRFDVYERATLDALMKEQGLQASGIADPKSAVALGKLAGVQYIMVGTAMDYGREQRVVGGHGYESRSTLLWLTVGIKVIAVQTGKIVFSKTESVELPVMETQTVRVEGAAYEIKLMEKAASILVEALVADEQFRGATQAGEELVPITIASEPTNAEIEIDGVFYGNTGLEIKAPPGLRQVTVSIAGYEPWSKKMHIQKGATVTLYLKKLASQPNQLEAQ